MAEARRDLSLHTEKRAQRSRVLTAKPIPQTPLGQKQNMTRKRTRLSAAANPRRPPPRRYLCKSVHHSVAESATRNRSLKPWSLSAKSKEVATYTTAYIRITINNIQHAEFQNMFLDQEWPQRRLPLSINSTCVQCPTGNSLERRVGMGGEVAMGEVDN